MSQFPREKGGGSGFGLMFFRFWRSRRIPVGANFSTPKTSVIFGQLLYLKYIVSIWQTEMTVYGSAFVHVKKNTNFGCGIKDSSQTFTQEGLRLMKYYIRIDEEVELYQYEIFGEYVSIDYLV